MVLYANTKKQLLASHSALIGLVAEKILNTFYPNAPSQLSSVVRWAGFLHDLGKIDPNFQQYIESQTKKDEDDLSDGSHINASKKGHSKFNWNQYPRHNEISWLLILSLFSNENLRQVLDKNIDGLDILLYAVYWHHAKPLRDSKDIEKFTKAKNLLSISELSWIKQEDTFNIVSSFVNDVINLTKETLSIKPTLFTNNHQIVPDFKSYNSQLTFENLNSAVTSESYNAMVRSCVVGADRIISTMTAVEIENWLDVYQTTKELPAIPEHPSQKDIPFLRNQIDNLISKFNLDLNNAPRNKEQDDAAEKLIKHNINVLYGPAGCGKTKIILQTLFKSSPKRTFIFVPRVAIGHGLFYELINEYKVTRGVEFYSGDLKLYFNETTKEIDVTPENSQLQGSIVITTIDQLCGITLSHKKIDLLTEVMDSHVIFDEFHELLDIPAIVLMFLEFMKLRSLSPNNQTLLVSATPNPFLLKCIDKLEDNFNAPPLQNRLCKIPTFNKKPYVFEKRSYHIDAEHPFLAGISVGDIAVSNKVSTAQHGAINSLQHNKPTLCFHSKYTAEHKMDVLNQVMMSFGKSSGSNTHALFAGPIVQASLNITTRVLHSDACTAENFLQRLGRVNRFGTFEQSTIMMYDIIDSKNIANQVDARLLNQLNQKNRAQAWLDWCIKNHLYGDTTLQNIYTAYDLFHEQPSTEKAYLEDFRRVLKDSGTVFQNNGFDPIQYPPLKKTISQKKLSSTSLRGASYYVLPMVYEINNNKQRKHWLLDDNGNAILTDDLMFLMGLVDTELAEYTGYLSSSDVNTLQYKKYFSQDLSSLKNKKRLSLSSWKYHARDPRYPVVLTFEGASRRQTFEKIYLHYNNTWIGLIPRDLGIINLKDKEIFK